MKLHSTLPYYLSATAIFILLKYLYAGSTYSSIEFLILPTAKLVDMTTGCVSILIPGKGYFYPELKIIIEKSCSGYNFWLITFLMLAILSFRYFDRKANKILAVPGAMVAAYILTLVVNTARILVSILVQQQANRFLPERPHLILHDLAGIVTNLCFLILIYLIAERYLTNIKRDAQTA